MPLCALGLGIIALASRNCHSDGMYVHSTALCFGNETNIWKWENTIQICYCCFNLQSHRTHLHTLHGLFSVPSISFCLYSIFRAFVIAFVHVSSHTKWKKKRKITKEFQSYGAHNWNRRNSWSLYATYVRLKSLNHFLKHTSACIQCSTSFAALLQVFSFATNQRSFEKFIKVE